LGIRQTPLGVHAIDVLDCVGAELVAGQLINGRSFEVFPFFTDYSQDYGVGTIDTPIKILYQR
jgi:hypothetical protein